MIKTQSRVARLAFAALLALSVPVLAAAQAVSGTILGTVTDSSGAVVAGAKVTLINEGTGLTRTVMRTSTASTRCRRCRPGATPIMSEMTGFKTRDALEHRARRRPARPHRTSSSRSAR